MPERHVTAGNEAFLGGDLDTAEREYAHAYAILEQKVPNSLELARLLINMANVATTRGRQDEAIALLERALVIQRREAPRGLDLAPSLITLALAVDQRGETDRSVALLREAQEIVGAVAPRGKEMAAILLQRGEIDAAANRLDDAERHFLEALAIVQELDPDGLHVAGALDSLGGVLETRGDLDEAERHFERALAIRRRLAPGSVPPGGFKGGKDSDEIASSLMNLGTIAWRRGDLEGAVELYQRVVTHREHRLPGSLDLATAWNNLGEIYREAKRPRAALDAFRQANTALESLVGRLGASPEIQGRFRARYLSSYRNQLQLEIDLGLDEDAFRTLERSRARGFLALLAERELEAALDQPEPLGPAAVRDVLDPGTVLVAWSVDEMRTDVLLLDRESGLETRTLRIDGDELDADVELLLRLLPDAVPGARRGDAMAARLADVSRRLYGTLLAPLEDRLEPARRILVIPSSPLYALPWQALRRPSGDYVAEWKSVYQVMSGTVYAELRHGQSPEDEGAVDFVAFGDPDYSAAVGKATNAGPVVSAALERGFGFEPLPMTRVEVEEIALLYEGAWTHLGAAATEVAVRSLGSRGRRVHFAVHGLVDEDAPLDSALALTIPDTSDPGGNDGLLQAWEILEDLRLGADLVVLSACSSAAGQEVAGEGLQGLARAFQYAGARSVIGSLWNVSDATTTELMVRFYRHLQDKSKAEALRAARLDLIRGAAGSEAAAPYYWAAFQLYGDWR